MANFGYWIGQRFTRQGLMQEAVGAMVGFSFNILGLRWIEAACLPDNTASRQVLEKTGFKYEGVAQSYLQIYGPGTITLFIRFCAATGAVLRKLDRV